jgi:sodium pump decarboxylase gamma subunit
MLYNVLTKSRDIGLGESSLYSILGYAVVFLGIAFLIVAVWAIGKAFTAKKQDGKTIELKKAEKSVEVAPVVEEEEISEEILAVITASIMAYYETTQPQCEFIVKRIKRI